MTQIVKRQQKQIKLDENAFYSLGIGGIGGPCDRTPETRARNAIKFSMFPGSRILQSSFSASSQQERDRVNNVPLLKASPLT